MKRRTAGRSGMFSLQIEEWQLKALAAIEQTFQDVVIQVGESLVNLTPEDTGRAKGSWVLTIDRPASQSPERYDKGGNETIAALVAAANGLEPGQIAYIVSTLVYMPCLEFGLYPDPPKTGNKTVGGFSKMAPRGMVRITVEQFQMIVRQAVERNKV